MRLVERIRCKLFPVAPNLFQNFRVVPVLLSARNEFRLHLIQFVAKLLTHGLTQGVGFTAGKVGQQTREQHHLLLINRNAIGIFQILFHDRQIVFDRLTSLFTVDKVGDVVHRSRTIQGIHGNQILERTGFEFAKIFLHTRRFELECTDGTALAI